MHATLARTLHRVRIRCTRRTIFAPVALAAVVAGIGLGELAPSAAAAGPSKRDVLSGYTGLASTTSHSVGLSRTDRRAARRLVLRSRGQFARGAICAASRGLVAYRARVGRAGGRRGRRARVVLIARAAALRAAVLARLSHRKGCAGPNTVDVDPRLRPARRVLPKLRRPVARVSDGGGQATDFVTDELVVAPPCDPAAVARRVHGRVVTRRRPGPGLPEIGVVRFNPSRVPTSRLSADLARASKVKGSALRVSSGAGLGTLAAAARAARSSRCVGVNWVGRGQTYATGSTYEGPSGPGGFDITQTDINNSPWTANAYNVSYLAGGGPQRIGTARAWTLLDSLGLLRRGSVRLGILDEGFSPAANGADIPPNIIARSNVPSIDALESRAILGCSGGSACPWHGTWVVDAAMGVPDNGLPAAGPAGPVAQPILVYTSYDYVTSIFAVGAAEAAGARVVNMSYGANVPAAFAWTAAPFSAVTAAARSRGLLLFASAGNSSTDVSDTDCALGLCWESEFWAPCENLGVVCVGALMQNGMGPAGYSNSGRRVDIWAPGTTIAGRIPDSGPQAVNGTSFASPYAAGVAALLWAAVPSASANQIQSAIMRTAVPGAGAATRVIQADAALRSLLPPRLHIASPTNGTTVRRGTNVTFTANTFGAGRTVGSISWTIDGTPLGTGATITRNQLPYGGPHRVVASAQLSDGTPISDSISITTTNDAPRVAITTPTDGAHVFQGQTISLRGTSTDVNQPENEFKLTDSQTSWALDGAPLGNGHDRTLDLSSVSVGAHTLTFTGNDGHGRQDTATAHIVVDPRPANLPPSVRITSPANNASFPVRNTPDGSGRYYADVRFTTTASDPESDPLAYLWTDSISGVVSREPSPTIRLYVPASGCGQIPHDVTVTVSDGHGNTATDRVRVSVHGVPC